MKAGDVYVGVQPESGVYLLLREVKSFTPTVIAWECLVLDAARYWHEREGDIVKNTEEWLSSSFVKAENL